MKVIFTIALVLSFLTVAARASFISPETIKAAMAKQYTTTDLYFEDGTIQCDESIYEVDMKTFNELESRHIYGNLSANTVCNTAIKLGQKLF